MLLVARVRLHEMIHLLLQNGADLGVSTFKHSSDVPWREINSNLRRFHLASFCWMHLFYWCRCAFKWPRRQSVISNILKSADRAKYFEGSTAEEKISTIQYLELLRAIIATESLNSVASFAGDGNEVRLLSRLSGRGNSNEEEEIIAAELWKVLAKNGKSELHCERSERLYGDFVLTAALLNDYRYLKLSFSSNILQMDGGGIVSGRA